MDENVERLLDDIQQDALNDEVPINSVLRKCVALGGQSGSGALQTWASKELKGYAPADGLPDYRLIPAFICMDYTVPTATIKGEQISVLQLPKAVHDNIIEEVAVQVSLTEIVEAANAAIADGEAVKISLPFSSAIIPLMNAEYVAAHPGALRKVNAVYWAVNAASFLAIPDVVRTTAVELVAKLRPLAKSGSSKNLSKVVDNAVNIVLNGDGNILHVDQSTGTWRTIVNQVGQESLARRVMFWVSSFVTVVAAIFGIIQFLILVL